MTWISLLQVAVVFLCYYNTLNCGFVYNDEQAVITNNDLRPNTSIFNLFNNDFWGRPINETRSDKSYYPLSVLTLRLNYAVGGLNPFGYHLVNVALHAVNCVMVYRACQLFTARSTSLLASLLFAVHPIHTEAVAGIVGRAELLSSFFFLFTFLTYAQTTRKVWGCVIKTVILSCMAMLCKEQGITAIGVCIFYEIFIVNKLSVADLLHLKMIRLKHRDWKTVTKKLGFLVISYVILVVTRNTLTDGSLSQFASIDNPASSAPSPTRQLTFNYLLPFNMWLLLCPSSLCVDWSMGTIPLVESVTDVRNIATLLMYVGVATLATYMALHRGQRTKEIMMSLALMVLPFIPVSNLFFPVDFVVAERVLYMPSIGYCTLVAVGFSILQGNSTKILGLAQRCTLVLLVLSHVTKTITRNNDWTSPYTIFKSALRVTNDNARIYHNLGYHHASSDEQFKEALHYFQEAIRLSPKAHLSVINAGRMSYELENYEQAELYFRNALGLMKPSTSGQKCLMGFRGAWNHLGVSTVLGQVLAQRPEKLLEADSLLQSVIKMAPTCATAYSNHGELLLKLNRTEEALKQFQAALLHEDDNPDHYFSIGTVMMTQYNFEEANRMIDQALQLYKTDKTWPRLRRRLQTWAFKVYKNTNEKLGIRVYDRMARLFNTDAENTELYYVIFLTASQFINDPHVAEQWLSKILEMDPYHKDALFSAAELVYNKLKRPKEAAFFVRRLLQSHPRHIGGLQLLKSINTDKRVNGTLTGSQGSGARQM